MAHPTGMFLPPTHYQKITQDYSEPYQLPLLHHNTIIQDSPRDFYDPYAQELAIKDVNHEKYPRASDGGSCISVDFNIEN